ncbi:MAG TPA: hypothetical protein VGG28_01620 [Kofleriaceae bacterium]
MNVVGFVFDVDFLLGLRSAFGGAFFERLDPVLADLERRVVVGDVAISRSRRVYAVQLALIGHRGHARGRRGVLVVVELRRVRGNVDIDIDIGALGSALRPVVRDAVVE